MVLIQQLRRPSFARSFHSTAQKYANGHIRRAMASASMTLYVKGNPETKELGDCPFCHRVLLTMEQKSLNYERGYIAFANKPQWLLDVNPSGTVPVLKHNEAYIPDSGAIVEYLEKEFPSQLVPEDPKGMEVTDGIFGAFRNYFLNQDAAQDETLKQNLHGELLKLESHLGSISGPFLGGETFNAADVSILPKMHHMAIALSYFKSWTFPEDCHKVRDYLKSAEDTDVWKRCIYSSDLVLEGWGSKLSK